MSEKQDLVEFVIDKLSEIESEFASYNEEVLGAELESIFVSLQDIKENLEVFSFLQGEKDEEY